MAPQTFAIIETTNPAQGAASITHDPLGGAPDSIKRKTRTIKLEAPPWDYCPPTDPRNGYAVLTLILDRNVRMLWNKADWYGGQYFGPDNPRLILIRAQNSSLIPPRHAPIIPHQIVRGTYPWASARDDTLAWWTRPLTLRNARINQSATVIPFENGVTVRHDGGEFEFSVTVPLAERSAFVYEIIFPQELGYSLRCVHTSNVKISGWLTRDFEGGIPQVFIDHAVVHRIDQVPDQGAVLSPDRYKFEPFTDWKIQFSTSTRRVISVLEAVIGVIPVIGAIYDAAQLVYTVANGRSFWGETIALSDDEVCLQGFLAILNLATSAAEVTAAIRRVIKSRPSFAPILDSGVADAIRQRLDERIINAAHDLSSDENKKVAGAITALAEGQTNSRSVLSVINQEVASKVKTLDDERALANLFSVDRAGFRADDLQAGYETYLAKEKGAHFGPLDWALRQSTGRYVEILRRELGPDFRSVLQTLKSKNVMITVVPEALEFIRKYGTSVSHYRDLRRAVPRGYGAFFEVDHLFEKRFWKSPRLNDIIDQSDFLGMIVAKDEQIARQIPGYTGYVHSQKTVLLRDLIPNGEEDLFTMQQWWDAHVWVGRQVGIPKDVLEGHLRDEFEFLIAHSDHPEKVNFRFNQAETDFVPPNWRPR
jgi:hypothetical protein